MNPKRKDLVYYALAVLIPTTMISVCFRLFHVGNWVENAIMFLPGMVAAALLLVRRQSFRSIGWGFRPPIYFLWGLLLPMVVITVSVLISLQLGLAAAKPFSSAAGGATGHLLRVLKGVGMYTLISIPFAFGEEFGWRGYAQARLVREFGLLKGLLLLGILWGVWHVPIYYFMGAFPQHPIVGPFVMTPIDNILAVVPMAWLYIRSRNIWVPTLTHAFADIVWSFSSMLFPSHNEIASWAILQSAQLILSIVLLMNLRLQSGTANAASLSASPVSA
jgi:membrane protease YdiL (CAAX protease family)